MLEKGRGRLKKDVGGERKWTAMGETNIHPRTSSGLCNVRKQTDFSSIPNK